MKKIIFLIIIGGLILASCTNELDKRILKVSYGTSFGECFGYCNHKFTLTPDSTVFTCLSNGNTLPLLNFWEKTTLSWDSISKVNLSNSFFELPELIGCPDCADGGAEWLEIQLNNGSTHKVTFEYYREPAILTNYITKCRQILSKNQCQ